MIELPRWDGEPGDAARCVVQIDSWARELRDHPVLGEFSPQTAAQLRGLEGADLFDALDDFSARNWDFRGGKERNQASVAAFSTSQQRAIEDAAARLGLDGTPPPSRTSYDAVIMTGGMVRAGIVKPRYLRELADRGLQWHLGVFLGGFRPFAGDELQVAPKLGVEGNDEFDAMSAGMKHAFNLGPADFTEGLPGTSTGAGREDSAVSARWREDSWDWNGRNLRVVAAPSSDPHHRRANTEDTFRFWARRTPGIRSVLVITTPVYVPYQGSLAIEILGLEFGLSVETVAVSDSASDLGEYTQHFGPQQRAQEMRSAVRGMRSLRARIGVNGSRTL